MKKLLYLIPVALLSFAMTSCKLDYFPSDELNADSFLQSAEGAQSIIDGCYSMFKDETDYLHYSSGNSYVRHYFQYTEFPSDNVCNSNRTSDALYQANTLTMYSELSTIGVMWWTAYKVIFSCNQVIETCKEGSGMDQLIGEAYFLRAMCHFHMVTLFAKPYCMGTSNLGVVLRTSTNTNENTRATVGECYTQIVKDLQKASELMTSRAGANKGYASKDAALGLLSRVYLYMGEYDNVISTVKSMGVNSPSDAAAKLDPDLANYFINAKTSQETLFCCAHTALETRGQSSIGSMLLTDGIGWGEIYPSDPLMNLWNRYMSDIRYSAFVRPVIYNDSKLFVYFPGIKDANNPSRFSPSSAQATKNGDEYKMTYEGKTYAVKQRDVNGGAYKQWYVEKYDGENLDCRIMPQLTMAPNGGVVPMYYYTKFGYQDGDAMLSSPVFLRWGEVVLNLAEAYAQKGQDGDALDLVNVVRKRAGIPAEGMFAVGNLHGYDKLDASLTSGDTKVYTGNAVVDIVLDERRMELAFEGHRMFDQVRNKLNVDRRYAGVQYWEIVKWDETRIQCPIPFDEVSTSGIEQNPGY